MSAQVFDDLTEAFESSIDWPRRLAHETPFYRQVFSRVPVKRVIDVACGTGHHAAMFHSWSLEVQGADISPKMIEHARQAFGEKPDLRWLVRGYEQPIVPDGGFDAAICVGNSLALAPSVAVVDAAIARMMGGVRPGGVVIIHVLNIWSVPEGPCRWQKNVHAQLSAGPAIITKGIHRCRSRAYVELIVNSLNSPGMMKSQSITTLGLEAADLQAMFRKAGAAEVSLFGGYRDEPFDRAASVGLVLVARK